MVPLQDLDDERLLILKTHSTGRGHTAVVYDDDGFSTKAEREGEYFELFATTAFDEQQEKDEPPATMLSLRVNHAQYVPQFTSVRWEVAVVGADASSSSTTTRWTSVLCNGEVLPLLKDVADPGSTIAGGGAWSVSLGQEVGGRRVAMIALPLALVADVEEGLHCVAR